MLSPEHRLDVINCKKTSQKIIEHKVYICPAKKNGHYDRHKEAKYFGLYANKVVSHVARIIAVVDIMRDTSKNIILPEDYSHLAASPEEIKNIAQERLELHETDSDDNKVFILDDLVETDFQNDNPPFRRHNIVFDISSFSVTNASELAKMLNGKKWSEVPEEKK